MAGKCKCKCPSQRKRMSNDEWEKMRNKMDKEAGKWDRERQRLKQKGLID